MEKSIASLEQYLEDVKQGVDTVTAWKWHKQRRSGMKSSLGQNGSAAGQASLFEAPPAKLELVKPARMGRK